MDLFDTVKFDANGLVTAVVQDESTHEVLMVAYMNREALQQTLQTGKVTYWSRSRQELWVKGATKQYQELRGLAVVTAMPLVRVAQTGAACHTGHRSCFYRRRRRHHPGGRRPAAVDPKEVYR